MCLLENGSGIGRGSVHDIIPAGVVDEHAAALTSEAHAHIWSDNEACAGVPGLPEVKPEYWSWAELMEDWAEQYGQTVMLEEE